MSVQFSSVLLGHDTWPSSQSGADLFNISVHLGAFCPFLREETEGLRSSVTSPLIHLIQQQGQVTIHKHILHHPGSSNSGFQLCPKLIH